MDLISREGSAAKSATAAIADMEQSQEKSYEHATVVLPDRPLVVIEPSKSWVPLHLGDLWAYRELLYFLTWRDVKVRYKQTELGVAWAIIQPLLTMLIFSIFFGRLAGVP